MKRNLPWRIAYAAQARTRVKRAAQWLLHAETSGTELQWLVGYEAGQLLTAAVESADAVAELLNADDVEEARDLAWQLYDRLRARVLAEKLSNVEGRTDEEAAAFLARADELRARAGRS